MLTLMMLLHFNPGQTYGKEISPWEISRLRLGGEAISEIIAELEEDSPSRLEILDERNILPGFKAKPFYIAQQKFANPRQGLRKHLRNLFRTRK